MFWDYNYFSSAQYTLMSSKKLLLLLACCTLPVIIFAQVNRDSLLNELRKPGIADTLRSNINNKIARSYFPNESSKAIAYLHDALYYAEKSNFPKGKAVSHHLLGIAFHMAENADSSVYHYLAAIPIYEQLGLKNNVAGCYRNIGLDIRERGNRNKALDYFIKANKIFEEAGDRRSVAMTYSDLAHTYTEDEQYEKALDFHHKALEIYESIKDTAEIIVALNGIGTVKRYQLQYEEALQYDKRSLDLSQKTGSAEGANYAMHEIGTTNLFMKNYKEAINWLQKSIDARVQQEEKGELAYSYNYLGESYLALNNYEKAQQAFEAALKVSKEIKNSKQELETYEYFSRLYGQKNDYPKAYYYKQLYSNMNDSINRINKSREMAELQTQYETAKKEKEIQQQKFEIEKRNYWIIGISSILLFATLLGLSYYRRYKLKQEATLQAEIMKQQDLATRAVLEAEERERQRIARDLHDGIGQTMSVAKMNLAALEGNVSFSSADDKTNYEKAMALVDKSCKEVRAVSHNMMPNTLLKAGLVGAVREFIDKIDSAVLKVNLGTEGLNERLGSEVEIVLYRVIQECVNNVIKHANANHLEISIIKDKDGISATIEDNGKGFDTNDKEKFKGIGLKNILTRIGFLKGTVDFDSSPGKGTLVAIHIPAQ